MNAIPDWWQKPRRISVLVDNPSWILPHAQTLVDALVAAGDQAVLCRTHDDVAEGAVAFLLGCVHITPPGILARNQRNLVVHASDLPRGRGFSPWTWMTIEGKTDIPVCLLEAAEAVDSGPVVFRDSMRFEGHELLDELRAALGAKTIELCRCFLDAETPPAGLPQEGEPSWYGRRRPADSAVDPMRPIAEQFDLLRTVDNERYPAFFDFRGHRYVLRIEKAKTEDES